MLPLLSATSRLIRRQPAALISFCSRAYGTAAHERNATFNALNQDDVAFFRQLLGSTNVITEPSALEAFNRDWMGKYQGAAALALRPRTTQQVSEALAYCSLRKLALVPQGGNTGLVGGGVPLFDEVVLSLGAMDSILGMDEVSGVLTAQAGCVLQTLDEAAAAKGFAVPLDLGAKGSCQIGGNVSTNAGGLRLLRYGSLHGSVLGLEVVLADGTVLDLMSQLRKDNTGFDLKQLFIGAEGSLGVVTAVSLQCAPRPRSVQVALVQAPSFQAVQGVLGHARASLGEILSAVEFLDTASMQLVTHHLPGVFNPLAPQSAAAAAAAEAAAGGALPAHVGIDAPPPAAAEVDAAVAAEAAAGEEGASCGGGPFYMVVETRGSHEAHDQEKLDEFLETIMDTGLITNGTVAESGAQAAAIWRVREGITNALGRRGATYKYDLSLPLPHMYTLVEVMRDRLAAWPDVVVAGYGHVGDGNLHLNISTPEWSCELAEQIEPFVYEWTSARGGSISAEHGLGQMKAEAMVYSKPPAAVEVMAQLKQLLDPHGILNPYKVLPAKHLRRAYHNNGDGARGEDVRGD